jgi:hypothetical protein
MGGPVLDPNLGDMARMLCRETDACDGYDRAVSLLDRLVAENPARTLYRSHLAWSFRGVQSHPRHRSRDHSALLLAGTCLSPDLRKHHCM